MPVTPLPELAQPYLLGIDIAHGNYDGNDPDSIQFHALADLTFVIHKATQGVGFKDPCFASAWPRMLDVGLVRGAYHFFLGTENPIAQAKFFIDTVNAAGGLQVGDIPLILDIEQDPATGVMATPSQTYQAAKYIKAQTGFWPVPYLSASPYVDDFEAFFPTADYTVWIADYSDHLPVNGARFWQYSDQSTVMGIKGDVDADAFLGDLATLKAICVRDLG